MNRKITGLALGALLFALCATADAQPAKKVPRIGYLAGASFSSSSMAARVEAFRQVLRELGYVEGKTIVIEWRSAEENTNRLKELAAELVRLQVDVIVTGGSTSTRSAKQAPSTIPIVMVQDDDPVGSGFVASLARPGGNITGLSTLSPALSGNRLELLKEVVPGLSRVAVIGNLTSPGSPEGLKEIELAAEAFRVKLQHLDVQNPNDIETAFRAAGNGRADAVLELSGSLLISARTRVAELAAKSRLPAIYHRREFVEAGGLMSYATNIIDLERRAAIYVDKILNGAKPADLPVEQPKKFEFVINLKAAKQIGLTIPPTVLARADKVIRRILDFRFCIGEAVEDLNRGL